jgi:hypothetical protein
MSYKTDWDKIGYDLEELYFEKLNRELINKLKQKTTEEEARVQNTEPMGVVLQFRSRNVAPAPTRFDPSAEKKAA